LKRAAGSTSSSDVVTLPYGMDGMLVENEEKAIKNEKTNKEWKDIK
jgi:hypothetical protein